MICIVLRSAERASVSLAARSDAEEEEQEEEGEAALSPSGSHQASACEYESIPAQYAPLRPGANHSRRCRRECQACDVERACDDECEEVSSGQLWTIAKQTK